MGRVKSIHVRTRAIITQYIHRVVVVTVNLMRTPAPNGAHTPNKSYESITLLALGRGQVQHSRLREAMALRVQDQ